jgi:hypothetical protein
VPAVAPVAGEIEKGEGVGVLETNGGGGNLLPVFRSGGGQSIIIRSSFR